MRNISILIFVAALIFGSLTVLMTRSYVNSQRAKPEPVVEASTSDQEMGTLVVAAGPLNFGDEITAEMLREVPWPEGEDVRPANSFDEISDVLSGTRRVAIRSMAQNEPIVQEKISGFGYRATLSQVIDPDMRAVAVAISEMSAAGGFILPGDRVDVIYTRDERLRGEERIAESKLLVRDVRVLAVDQTVDESTEGAVVAKTATLEVSSEQSQKIALAARVGELDLNLRPMVARGGTIDQDNETIMLVDLTNDNKVGVKPEAEPQVAPRTYRPVSRRAAAKPAVKVNPFGTMSVTRGTQTSEDTVIREDMAAAASGQTLAGNGTSASTGTYPSLVGGSMPPTP